MDAHGKGGSNRKVKSLTKKRGVSTNNELTKIAVVRKADRSSSEKSRKEEEEEERRCDLEEMTGR